MKTILSALAAGILVASAAQSATFDLTDKTFVSGSVTYDTYNPINGFQEEADGVTFTFATAGQFRSIGEWLGGAINPTDAALSFGGGAGNPTSFTMSVDTDVTLNAFLGFDQLYNTGAIFDVVGDGVSSIGNTFSTAAFLSSGVPVAENFVGGGLSLTAGSIYSFTASNAGALTRSYFTGFDFTKAAVTPAPSPVPLPAGLPLLLAGLGAFSFVKRRKTA
ncbi:VPLPA-CTERM sorting domain-containing protein [Octadecabacter sp. CECT 8868]|uniref:VPLPA-CTERM sorting domain-containing protein n=1 Tax=Octadecabacter algicola TaxID=2909342 RepID=UPI001F3493C5|nr:VPLPA-CTERM sorting domain-containing protein [Octadecabacter algicola]MCF2905240.1 VPLPA-CTERM sorting domain-containing protein [Octadecabacter algicola]